MSAKFIIQTIYVAIFPDYINFNEIILTFMHDLGLRNRA